MSEWNFERDGVRYCRSEVVCAAQGRTEDRTEAAVVVLRQRALFGRNGLATHGVTLSVDDSPTGRVARVLYDLAGDDGYVPQWPMFIEWSRPVGNPGMAATGARLTKADGGDAI